jgi:hypothetical protein
VKSDCSYVTCNNTFSTHWFAVSISFPFSPSFCFISFGTVRRKLLHAHISLRPSPFPHLPFVSAFRNCRAITYIPSLCLPLDQWRITERCKLKNCALKLGIIHRNEFLYIQNVCSKRIVFSYEATFHVSRDEKRRSVEFGF